MSDAKQAWVERAKQANVVERYDDMAAAMKKVAELNPVLSNEERALMNFAYAKVIDRRMNAWRILSSIEQKTEGSEQKQRMTKEFREKVQSEIKEMCDDVLGLLDNILIPNSTNAAIKVWYLKMKTQYYWHSVEVAAATGKKNEGGEVSSSERTSPPVKQFSSVYSASVIGDLSDADLAEVFKYLPPHDRLLTSEVCKRWYAISRMPWLDVVNLHLTDHDYDRCLGAVLKQCSKLRTFFADHLIPENVKSLYAFTQMRSLSSLKLDCPECELPEQDSPEYDLFLAMFSDRLPEASWEELVLNELHLAVHVSDFESAYGCSVGVTLPVSLRRLQLSGGIQLRFFGSEGVWLPTSSRLLAGLGRLENLTCLLLDGMDTHRCALNRALYSSDTFRALEALTSLVELGISWTRFLPYDHEDIAKFCYALPQLEVLFLNNVRCWQSEEYLGKLTTKHPKLRIFVITGVFRGERTVPLRRRYPNGFGSDPLPLLHVFLGKSASENIVLTRSSSDSLKAYPITEALASFLEKEDIAPVFEGVWMAEQIKEGARREAGTFEYAGPAATLIRIEGDE